MSGKSPSLNNVLAALPAVQAAIRDEVGTRIAAGEAVVGEEWQAKRKVAAKRTGKVQLTTPRRTRSISQTAA